MLLDLTIKKIIKDNLIRSLKIILISSILINNNLYYYTNISSEVILGSFNLVLGHSPKRDSLPSNISGQSEILKRNIVRYVFSTNY